MTFLELCPLTQKTTNFFLYVDHFQEPIYFLGFIGPLGDLTPKNNSAPTVLEFFLRFAVRCRDAFYA